MNGEKMTNEEIQILFQQFKKDFCVMDSPKLIVKQLDIGNSTARVGNVNKDFAELFLNKSLEGETKDYLESVLYHDAVSMTPEYRFPLKRKCGFLHIGTPVSNLRNWGVKPPGILKQIHGGF